MFCEVIHGAGLSFADFTGQNHVVEFFQFQSPFMAQGRGFCAAVEGAGQQVSSTLFQEGQRHRMVWHPDPHFALGGNPIGQGGHRRNHHRQRAGNEFLTELSKLLLLVLGQKSQFHGEFTGSTQHLRRLGWVSAFDGVKTLDSRNVERITGQPPDGFGGNGHQTSGLNCYKCLMIDCAVIHTEIMPTFQYKVRSNNGQVITSTIEAESIDQVRNALRQRGFFIVDIKAPATGLNQDIKIPGLDRPAGLKEVAIFARQMATMIQAGVPLIQALVILQKQSEHKGMQETIRKVRSEVESGLSFSEALAKYPKVFNRLFLNLVRSGEVSGNLEVVLDRVSGFYEKELELRGKIKNALTYPAIVLVFAIAITYFLMTTIVPQFASILDQLGAEQPALTKALVAISNFLQHQTWLMILIVAAVTFALRAYYQTKQGRWVIDGFKLKVAVFGPLTQRSTIATFSRTFGLLLSSGVNIIESLDITKGTANNVIVESAISNAQLSVMSGDPMSNALATSPVFPPMVISMISIGEEAGALDQMLNKIADYYDREVEEAINSLTAAIEPIMIVVLGAIVGCIVAGMFLPMFSIINALSQ